MGNPNFQTKTKGNQKVIKKSQDVAVWKRQFGMRLGPFSIFITDHFHSVIKIISIAFIPPTNGPKNKFKKTRANEKRESFRGNFKEIVFLLVSWPKMILKKKKKRKRTWNFLIALAMSSVVKFDHPPHHDVIKSRFNGFDLISRRRNRLPLQPSNNSHPTTHPLLPPAYHSIKENSPVFVCRSRPHQNDHAPPTHTVLYFYIPPPPQKRVPKCSRDWRERIYVFILF